MKWIEVNGAKIEENFLKENISEAKQYSWIPLKYPADKGHAHCLICNISIPTNGVLKDKSYQSSGGWLCQFCYEEFIKNQ